MLGTHPTLHFQHPNRTRPGQAPFLRRPSPEDGRSTGLRALRTVHGVGWGLWLRSLSNPSPPFPCLVVAGHRIAIRCLGADRSLQVSSNLGEQLLCRAACCQRPKPAQEWVLPAPDRAPLPSRLRITGLPTFPGKLPSYLGRPATFSAPSVCPGPMAQPPGHNQTQSVSAAERGTSE